MSKSISLLIGGMLIGAFLTTAGFAFFLRQHRPEASRRLVLKLGHCLDTGHPVHKGMLEELKTALDKSGNVKASTGGKEAYKTSIDGVFAAGDMRRGQSLVVWAIREGRQCARAVDEYLMKSSELPR